MRVFWTAAARDDLQAIKDYIERRNPDAAKSVVSRVYTEVRGLKHHPMLGRPGRIIRTREFVVAPYVAIYRIGHTNIEILRLYHGAQDWPEGTTILP